jgi:hypothetical protein
VTIRRSSRETGSSVFLLTPLVLSRAIGSMCLSVSFVEVKGREPFSRSLLRAASNRRLGECRPDRGPDQRGPPTPQGRIRVLIVPAISTIESCNVRSYGRFARQPKTFYLFVYLVFQIDRADENRCLDISKLVRLRVSYDDV